MACKEPIFFPFWVSFAAAFAGAVAPFVLSGVSADDDGGEAAGLFWIWG